jgi:hypothetical protein
MASSAGAKKSRKAFVIAADTVFDPKRLTTWFEQRKSTRGCERVLKMSYDGCTSWGFEAEIPATKQYQDKVKDLTVYLKFPSGPYSDLPQNRAMSAARNYFTALSEEVAARYRREGWFAGVGAGGEAGIPAFDEIVKNPDGTKTIKTWMPEDRFRPLATATTFGLEMEATIYNYKDPNQKDFQRAVYCNARTMEKVGPDDLVAAVYPAFGHTEGSEIRVRPLMSKTWHLLGNTAAPVPTPIEENKKTRITTTRAYVELETYSYCNPKSDKRYAWTVKWTAKCIHLFVTQRRVLYLPQGPTRMLFTHAREDPTFTDMSPPWVKLICEENEKFRLKMAAGGSDASDPSDHVDPADVYGGVEADEEQRNAKKMRTE